MTFFSVIVRLVIGIVHDVRDGALCGVVVRVRGVQRAWCSGSVCRTVQCVQDSAVCAGQCSVCSVVSCCITYCLRL